jgi:hypothetical protein
MSSHDQDGYLQRKASFVEEITGQQLQAIKDRLKAGAYRKDAQATAWAGYVVGDVLGLASTKGRPRQAKTVVWRWASRWRPGLRYQP